MPSSEGPSFEAHASDEHVSEVWGPRQGLANPSVTAITQSTDGYLWVATRGGLYRFDGRRFERFNRANVPAFVGNHVSSLAATDDGAVWAAVQAGGLHRYHPATGWSHFGADDGVVEGVNGLVVDDRGRLLAMGERTVLEFAGERFHPLPAAAGCRADPVLQVGPALDGGQWWLDHHGLSHFKDGRCDAVYSLADGPLSSYSPITGFARHFHAALEIRPGVVLSGNHLSLNELQPGIPGSGTASARLLMNGAFTALAVAPGGEILIAQHDFLSKGVHLYDSDATPFRDLVDSRVTSLLRDSEEGLWVGTYNGLQRFQRRDIRNPPVPAEVRSSIAMSVFHLADDDILVGYFENVVRYRRGRVERVDVEGTGQSPRLIPFSFTRTADGEVWMAAGRGLYRLVTTDGGKQSFRDVTPAGLDDALIRHYFVDSRGHRYLSTDTGLFRLDGSSVRRVPGLVGVAEIFEDHSGRLWSATYTGLFELEDDRPRQVLPADGEPAIYIRRIVEDTEAGGLWLGTIGRGLQFLHTSGPRAGQAVAVTTADGLYDDDVWHILGDDRGYLWMCSDIGIFAARRDDLLGLVDGSRTHIESRNFGLEDGLGSLECNGGGGPAAFRADDGRLWFPTTAGPAVVDPTKLGARRLPFPAVVQQISVDEKSHALDAVGDTFDVSNRARSLVFHYTAPSLRDAGNIRFRYRLEPYDPEWRPTTAERSAVYGRLPPGRYRFHVQARGDDGVWAGEATSPELRVPTPAWRSPWAFVAYAGILFGSLLWFVRSQRLQVAVERAKADKQIKVLQGFLPICSMCKDIRGADGRWIQLETYIDGHSEAELSHGICPRCMHKNFDDLLP